MAAELTAAGVAKMALGTLLAGVASGVVSSIFNKPPKTPSIPEPKAAAPMPSPDDAAIRRARQRQLQLTQSRTGRESTFLSDFGRQTIGG